MEKQSNSFRDRIDRERGIERPVHQRCYKIDRTNKHPYSLIIEQEDGLEYAFKYMQLSGKAVHMPEVGIIMRFNDATIYIYGTQLDLLFKDLNDEKVTSVNVDNDPFIADVEPNQAIITKIVIEDNDTKMEQQRQKMRETAFKSKGRSGHAK